MPIEDILNLIGAISLLGYAVASLLLPRRVAEVIAQRLTSPRGVAEFRVVHGGYFAGLAGFALLVQEPLVFTALGIGWLGAAAARVVATLVDRPPLEPLYIGFLLLEIALGVMLLV